ncbi:MAG TPA: SgcJ/EcaC family oxidoreductase [Gemmatales bacterium]|nr:SgcJ/EcaC family oxidoreductase [Gemmatales bacterium]
MKQQRLIVMALLGSCLLLAQTAAQQSVKADSDLEAIKSTATKYGKAFETNDAAALGALFTDEAEFVDGVDNVVHGKKAIEEAFATLFKNNPKQKIVVDMDVVRRLSSTCLVEEGTYTFQSTADPKATAERSKYVMLHVKQPDGWKIASIRTNHELAVAHHEHLKSLDWLVGTWVDEGADDVIETAWKWSEDGNYLLGEFKITAKGKTVLKGTHRLGWDPLLKQIRSWVFDNQGGFSKGRVTSSGNNRWTIKSTGVSSDGDATSATAIYEKKSKDRFQINMQDRVQDGDPLPDLAITIVRAAPGPKPK